MSEAKPISPVEARGLIAQGAQLVDIRESEERQCVIPGARHQSLSGLFPGAVTVEAGRPIIFHCRTGRRTAMNAQGLCSAASGAEVYLLDGGLDAWAAAGLPLQTA